MKRNKLNILGNLLKKEEGEAEEKEGEKQAKEKLPLAILDSSDGAAAVASQLEV